MSGAQPEDAGRPIAAKRFNEGVKPITSALNALSVATIGAVFLLAAVNGAFTLNAVFWFWLSRALGLHIAGHVAAPEYLIGIPITGLVFGVLAIAWLRYEGRRLDRKYGRPPASGE